MDTFVAIIALGANLGDREAALREALQRLETAGMRVLGVSDFIETEPVGYTNQPDFLNGVAALELPKETTPEALLDLLLETEKLLGRERPFPNAPRTCDLDLLFFEAETRDTPELVLPHPRWRERAFVLIPLENLFDKAEADIQSWIVREPWNTLRKTVRALAADTDVSGIRAVSETRRR